MNNIITVAEELLVIMFGVIWVLNVAVQKISSIGAHCSALPYSV